jgi:hypothetical protein
MTRKEREELCKMSEESFGGKYDWLKYLRQPFYIEQDVATNKTLKMRKVKVAQWRTLEDVIKLMKGEETLVDEKVEVVNEAVE